MFAAAISLVGLAATVYLVLREAKAICAKSGTVAKSALGWSVAFGLFQLFLTIWGAIGLVAQNEPLAFVMLILTNAILTGCAWASIARDRIAPRVFAFASGRRSRPTGKLARLRGAFVGKPLVAAVLCLLLAGVFALLGMEVSSNHDFTWVYPLCILLEWAIITTLMVGLFFLFQRHGAAPAVLAFASLSWALPSSSSSRLNPCPSSRATFRPSPPPPQSPAPATPSPSRCSACCPWALPPSPCCYASTPAWWHRTVRRVPSTPSACCSSTCSWRCCAWAA